MAAINMPTRQEQRDPLDIVLKGLGIAQSIYGIKSDIAKAEDLRLQREALKPKLDAEAKKAGVDAEISKENLGKIKLDNQNQKDLLDASSPMSKYVAGQYRASGFNVPEGTSAAQIYNAYGKDSLSDKSKIGWQGAEARKNDEFKNNLDKPKKAQDQTDALRKEYVAHPVTKATIEVATSYDKIKKAVENPSAAGDLSLIFGYMKMLDPSSTVREGEFANAQNAAGVPTQLANLYNRAMNGERLSDIQRGDFSGQAKNLLNVQLSKQNELNSQYSKISQERGLDVKNIIQNYSTADEPKKDVSQGGGTAAKEVKELAGKSQADQLAAIRNAKTKKLGIAGSLPQKDSK